MSGCMHGGRLGRPAARMRRALHQPLQHSSPLVSATPTRLEEAALEAGVGRHAHLQALEQLRAPQLQQNQLVSEGQDGDKVARAQLARRVHL